MPAAAAVLGNQCCRPCTQRMPRALARASESIMIVSNTHPPPSPPPQKKELLELTHGACRYLVQPCLEAAACAATTAVVQPGGHQPLPLAPGRADLSVFMSTPSCLETPGLQ